MESTFLDVIAEGLGDAVIVTDASGVATYVSPSAEKLVGPLPRGVSLESKLALFRPDAATAIPPEEHVLSRALRGEPTSREEVVLRNAHAPEGAHLLVAGRQLKAPDGSSQGAVVVLRELTSPRPSQASDNADAEARVALLRAIVDHVAHPIFVKDRAFRFTFVNRALCELVAVSREDLIGKTDYDFFPAEQADFFRKKDTEMFESGASIVIDEEPITDAKGEHHVLATTKVPLFHASTEPTHLVGIIHDITQLKQAEEGLRAANEALEREVRDKSAALGRLEAVNAELEAFSYSVSHDLRAPLRSIDGFSQALLEDYGGRLEGDAADYLRRVRAAAVRMGSLIDDLLRLSRITRAELRTERVDLGEIARGVVAALRESAPERKVEVTIGEDLVAEGDPLLLRVALENLIGNAWKFTSKRTEAHIAVGADRVDGKKRFYIRDDGAGFDGKYASKLFNAFQRLHSSAEFEGTGVGLATVQRIVNRHGGRVWAEGESGKGATFWFTL
jgi:PAS domain S-box-containing protein